jgi:uncharacterized damage-inducible protein DinB
MVGWVGFGINFPEVTTMRLNMAAVAMLLGACSLSVRAQMPVDVPVGTVESPAKALNKLMGLYEYEVMGVVKAMPADKYSFAPAAGTFATGSAEKFDGVRTFAQEVTHVAQANFLFYSSLSGMKPDVDMKSIDAMTSKDDCVAVLAKSIAFAHKAIATITAENAFVGIKSVDGFDTRATIAAFGVAHGYDHYGQMVEYLRMNGIVPPGSK